MQGIDLSTIFAYIFRKVVEIMDCYILAMQELLAKGKLSEDEFAFLTNYSITNAWIDTEASSTFEVPVIFPEWFPNDDDIRELCPALCKETFRDFSTYLSFIKRKIEEGGIVTPFDRYYLDYITPRRHMGAHYVFVEAITDSRIRYLDFFDKKMHELSLKIFEKATEKPEHPYEYMGYTVFYSQTENSSLDLNEKFIKKILSKRVDYLYSSLDKIRGFAVTPVKDPRLCKFYLKIAIGGIINSDFYKKNGRFENYLFFRELGLMIPCATAKMIYGCYVLLAYLFIGVYKTTKTTEKQWKSFCRLYALILRYELRFYSKLVKKTSLIKNKIILAGIGR